MSQIAMLTIRREKQNQANTSEMNIKQFEVKQIHMIKIKQFVHSYLKTLFLLFGYKKACVGK